MSGCLTARAVAAPGAVGLECGDTPGAPLPVPCRPLQRHPGGLGHGPPAPVAASSFPRRRAQMQMRMVVWCLVALALTPPPTGALAEPMTLRVLPYSRATFKTEAPLETVIGNTSGPGVTG